MNGEVAKKIAKLSEHIVPYGKANILNLYLGIVL